MQWGITNHGLKRWRERVGPNDTIPDILAALGSATRIEKGEWLPIARMPHSNYYRLTPDGLLIVVTDARNPDREVLVTVYDARNRHTNPTRPEPLTVPLPPARVELNPAWDMKHTIDYLKAELGKAHTVCGQCRAGGARYTQRRRQWCAYVRELQTELVYQKAVRKRLNEIAKEEATP